MEIEFFNQPFDGTRRLGSFLAQELPAAKRFWVMSAWAQLSGMELIAPYLKQLRTQSTETQLLVGIDGGYATRPSLKLALDLFDSVHVFHDAGSRVYHPKIYCVEGGDDSIVVIGSSNLTSGGLYRNYEGNVSLKLSRQVPEDEKFLNRIREYWDQFFADGMPTRLLTNELLDALENSGSLAADDREEKETELVARAKRNSAAIDLFGKRTFRLPEVPQGSKRLRRRDSKPEMEMGMVVEEPLVGADLFWWKKLTRSDALRKDSASHQRNYVILGQGSFDIDQKSWFRHTLFKKANWVSETMRTGRVKETANIPFEVFIDDVRLGTYSVRIDHADHRVANQNNAPTWLNWSELMPLIRRQDFTDWYLVLERVGKSYRLRLTPQEPVNQ